MAPFGRTRWLRDRASKRSSGRDRYFVELRISVREAKLVTFWSHFRLSEVSCLRTKTGARRRDENALAKHRAVPPRRVVDGTVAGGIGGNFLGDV
jgi:hypothetical protein